VSLMIVERDECRVLSCVQYMLGYISKNRQTDRQQVVLRRTTTTMNDERTASDIVTEFLLSTTRLRPQINEHDVHAVAICAAQARVHRDDDVEAEMIPLITGSVAEFYIEPMLPRFGDLDIMCHPSCRLAIPRGHPPPQKLPAEFYNDVYVYEIVDSHLPGFVYLEERYLLTECPEYGEYFYNCTEREKRYYFCQPIPRHKISVHDQLSVSGPAIVSNTDHAGISSIDNVFCIRCLSWPPQAADWPTRYGNYDWPHSTTVDRVVNNGCDVVPVAHRQCRQHEWMSIEQVSVETVILTSRNCTVKQLDDSTTNCISYVACFCEDKAAGIQLSRMYVK